MIRLNWEGRPVGETDPNFVVGYRSEGADTVYNYSTADFLAANGEADQLVLGLYGLIAHAVTPGTYVGGEGTTIAPVPDDYYRDINRPPNMVTNAAILNYLRTLLVHETASDGKATGLDLAYSTPRGWLQPGKRIAVSNAPADFGDVSYTLEAPADVGVVDARGARRGQPMPGDLGQAPVGAGVDD